MKLTAKKIDNLIDQSYGRVARDVQINMMDIPKVFAEGRRAIAAGEDIDTALAAIVQKIRVN
jgi:hypothetical protein